MKTKIIGAICTICILLAAFSGVPVQAADHPAAGETYDGFLIAVDEASADPGLAPVIDNVYWTDDSAEIIRLIQDGCVEYIEPNYYVALEDSPEPESGDTMAYDMLNMACAEPYSLDGTGVRIALIDSGVDLQNENLAGAHIAPGYDYVNKTYEMSDSVSHGTKVAQMIAGLGVNGAVKGLAPGAEIVPLCCFTSSGGGTVALLAQAIEDAVDEYGCDVINMSWGIKSENDTLYKAIRYASEAGAVLVAAAGNVTMKYEQGTVLYPAGFSEVIGVGALNAQMTVADYSQQTSAVFTSAPGGTITFVGSDGNTLTDSGTSFSAPCVSAIAAITRQIVPEMDTRTLMHLLRERAVDAGNPGCDTAYGYGIPKLDSLILPAWSWLTESNMTFHGWLLHEGGGSVIGAAYSEDGRMCGAAVISDSVSVMPFSLSLSAAENASEYSLYYLDSTAAFLAFRDYGTEESPDE